VREQEIIDQLRGRSAAGARQPRIFGGRSGKMQLRGSPTPGAAQHVIGRLDGHPTGRLLLRLAGHRIRAQALPA
jgi:hypothetical protein